VLTATGDSVTSAHNQFGFGNMCANTSADLRNLTGNDANFSYAGRYYAGNPNVVKYYNFARTGFGTTEMLNAKGAGTLDACGNAWARVDTPVNLAAAAIKQAKKDGNKAYHVSTGGVNNTNWTQLLSQVTKCRGMEWAQANLMPARWTSFWWAAVGGKAGIVPNGGGCVLKVVNPNPFAMDWFFRVGVPGYNGPANYKAITADVTTVVNALLAAGADKIVWMQYYDITPAQIDVGNFSWTYLRGIAPGWVAGLMPPRVGPAVIIPLVDPVHVVAVKKMTADLNAAVVAGVPANPKVAVGPAVVTLAADIQNTALGGSPHPSAAGHTKMAAALNASFNAIP
jgi:hypothetical protein